MIDSDKNFDEVIEEGTDRAFYRVGENQDPRLFPVPPEPKFSAEAFIHDIIVFASGMGVLGIIQHYLK